MKKFRKKPVVIDAIQYTGENYEQVVRFMYPERPESVIKAGAKAGVPIFAETHNGMVKVEIWDYVIKGVGGECYPCNYKVFEATYEPAETNL